MFFILKQFELEEKNGISHLNTRNMRISHILVMH